MYTLIVGCGRMGSELAIMLSGEGHDVVVIDKSTQAFRRLGPAFNGMTIAGNGFNCEVLENAGIKQANALAAVTNDDNTNIIAVQIAKQIYNIPMAVARVYDPKKATTYNHLGLEIISSTMVISRMIRDRFLESRVEEFLTPRQDRIEFHTIEVKGALVGRPAGDLNRPGLFTVVTVHSRGRMTLPLPDYTLEEGDKVMGVGLVEGRDAIHNLLWGTGE